MMALLAAPLKRKPHCEAAAASAQRHTSAGGVACGGGAGGGGCGPAVTWYTDDCWGHMVGVETATLPTWLDVVEVAHLMRLGRFP